MPRGALASTACVGNRPGRWLSLSSYYCLGGVTMDYRNPRTDTYRRRAAWQARNGWQQRSGSSCSRRWLPPPAGVNAARLTRRYRVSSPPPATANRPTAAAVHFVWIRSKPRPTLPILPSVAACLLEHWLPTAAYQARGTRNNARATLAYCLPAAPYLPLLIPPTKN